MYANTLFDNLEVTNFNCNFTVALNQFKSIGYLAEAFLEQVGSARFTCSMIKRTKPNLSCVLKWQGMGRLCPTLPGCFPDDRQGFFSIQKIFGHFFRIMIHELLYNYF
uniref:Uncharacterized protein n=1 Tax=Anthurium amnicola TaxID=1678845 RepID=A0A1D1XEK3_9ARAE